MNFVYLEDGRPLLPNLERWPRSPISTAPTVQTRRLQFERGVVRHLATSGSRVTVARGAHFRLGRADLERSRVERRSMTRSTHLSRAEMHRCPVPRASPSLASEHPVTATCRSWPARSRAVHEFAPIGTAVYVSKCEDATCKAGVCQPPPNQSARCVLTLSEPVQCMAPATRRARLLRARQCLRIAISGFALRAMAPETRAVRRHAFSLLPTHCPPLPTTAHPVPGLDGASRLTSTHCPRPFGHCPICSPRE